MYQNLYEQKAQSLEDIGIYIPQEKKVLEALNITLRMVRKNASVASEQTQTVLKRFYDSVRANIGIIDTPMSEKGVRSTILDFDEANSDAMDEAIDKFDNLITQYGD